MSPVDQTLSQVVAGMASVPLPAGERRTYMRCRLCRRIFVRDYIPYGLGYGRVYAQCACFDVRTAETLPTTIAADEPQKDETMPTATQANAVSEDAEFYTLVSAALAAIPDHQEQDCGVIADILLNAAVDVAMRSLGPPAAWAAEMAESVKSALRVRLAECVRDHLLARCDGWRDAPASVLAK